MIINAEAQKHPAATKGLFKRRETEICPEGWNEYSSSLLSLLGLGWHQAAPGRLGPLENRGQISAGYLSPPSRELGPLRWGTSHGLLEACTTVLPFLAPDHQKNKNMHLDSPFNPFLGLQVGAAGIVISVLQMEKLRLREGMAMLQWGRGPCPGLWSHIPKRNFCTHAKWNMFKGANSKTMEAT